jgi:hypothetical protein
MLNDRSSRIANLAGDLAEAGGKTRQPLPRSGWRREVTPMT